jgi:hypothetical protein
LPDLVAIGERLKGSLQGLDVPFDGLDRLRGFTGLRRSTRRRRRSSPPGFDASAGPC